MNVVFCPIASGSNGNSTYIGASNAHILIDAGLSGKKIEDALLNLKIHPKYLDAIFVTHEHKDHIQSVGTLSRKYDIPIYATKKTWKQLEHKCLIGKISCKNKIYIATNTEYKVKDIVVSPFEVPHDAAEPVAYNIKVNNYKISTLTDVGHITDNLKEKIYNSDILLLESNHDINMLINGQYPRALKERILGDYGHLSNESAGKLLSDIACDKLKYVFLGHLSGDNNTPGIAYNTVSNIIESKNKRVHKTFKLFALNRSIATEPLIL